jgi:hypothetical protein
MDSNRHSKVDPADRTALNTHLDRHDHKLIDMDMDHSCDSEDGQSDDHIITRNHTSASSTA